MLTTNPQICQVNLKRPPQRMLLLAMILLHAQVFSSYPERVQAADSVRTE